MAEGLKTCCFTGCLRLFVAKQSTCHRCSTQSLSVMDFRGREGLAVLPSRAWAGFSSMGVRFANPRVCRIESPNQGAGTTLLKLQVGNY